MVKTTLRVPDRVMQALRRRSQDEKRSVNEVAVEALRTGLGVEEPEEWWHSLAPLKFTPPKRRFDREEFDRELNEMWERVGWTPEQRTELARGLEAALDGRRQGSRARAPSEP